jgi:FkbM family methyltransferase
MKVRDGEFDTVRVNGRKYVWPAYAPMEALLDLVAEQEMWCHPNRYLWGRTDIAHGDVVLDIGACEGSFSALAAERGGVVIAVEPSLVMGEALQLLFRLRGLKPPTLCDASTSSSATPRARTCASSGVGPEPSRSTDRSWRSAPTMGTRTTRSFPISSAASGIMSGGRVYSTPAAPSGP